MITPAVSVHGAVLVPFSKPGLPSSCWAAADVMVSEMVVVWLSAPDVPVMVIVLVPVAAVLLAVKVRTLVDAVGLVPNDAVTPLGKAEFESVTAPVKPPESVTVIVLLPLVPCFTARLAGEAESEKFGVAVAFTVSEMAVVCVSEPEVPVMVTVEVPVLAPALAVNVTALVDVVGLVPKAAVTPDGKPEADNVTLPLNPPEGVTVIVLLPLLPCVTVKLAGEADREKFGVAVAGGRTQLLAALENSSWMVYVVPLAVYEPCWPLQMSPISPLVMSYHARGAENVVAIPTSASVIASVNSWLVTDV